MSSLSLKNYALAFGMLRVLASPAGAATIFLPVPGGGFLNQQRQADPACVQPANGDQRQVLPVALLDGAAAVTSTAAPARAPIIENK